MKNLIKKLMKKLKEKIEDLSPFLGIAGMLLIIGGGCIVINTLELTSIWGGMLLTGILLIIFSSIFFPPAIILPIVPIASLGICCLLTWPDERIRFHCEVFDKVRNVCVQYREPTKTIYVELERPVKFYSGFFCHIDDCFRDDPIPCYPKKDYYGSF